MIDTTHLLISSNIQQATLFKLRLALLDELIGVQPRLFVLKAGVEEERSRSD